MNPWKKKVARTVVAATALYGSIGTIDAAEVVTIEPLQAVDFDFENKRAVSYFSHVNNTCELVLNMAEALEWIDGRRLMTSRFEAAIAGGRTGRVRVAEGKALEFTCHKGAQLLSVRWIEQIASSAPAK